jgi:uncharacterized protein YbjT (DUF2867 family)
MHLVVGASGQAGSAVVQRLLDRGEGVRAVSRDPQRLEAARSRGAETVRGDLLEERWMEAALDGVDVLVIASQGLYPPSRRNHPGRSDRLGIPRLLDAASKNGVKHAMFISADGAGPGASTLFMRLKYELEIRIRDTGLPHTIVRPTVFMENHVLLLMGEPLRAGGKVQFFGKGTTPLNWISAGDVADYIVGAILETGPSNEAVRLEGPDTLTRLQVLEILERRLGVQATRSHVPVGMIRVMRAVMGPVHPGFRYLLDLTLAEATAASAGAASATGSPALTTSPSSSASVLSAAPLTDGSAPSSQRCAPHSTGPSWQGPTTVEEVVERWAGG